MVVENLLALALAWSFLQQTPPRPDSATGPVRDPVELNELAQAEARYRAAIGLNPNISAYHYSLAVVLHRQGRTIAALDSYSEAVRLEPGSARNHGGFGEGLLEAGDLPRALTQLQAAARLDPGNVRYRTLLARVLIDQDMWVEAAQALREASLISPQDETIKLRLAEIEAKIGASPLPGADGYHDLSEFPDERGGTALSVLEWLLGGVLLAAGLALLIPILGTLFLLLVQAPLAWARAASAK